MIEEFSPFRGKLRKISISSELSMYFCPPDDYDGEYEQHLTINDKGRVWFKAMGHVNREFKQTRKKTFTVDKKGVEFLFNLIEMFFANREESPYVLDGGTLNIELSNTDGETFYYHESLSSAYVLENISLSDVMRDVLNMKDIFAFDGNAKFHVINKITLDFTRVKTFIPDNMPKEIMTPFVTWEYKEQIVVDRESQSLCQYVVVGKGCKIAHEYEVQGGINELLDGLDGDILFREIPQTPDNVINNPDDISLYRINVEYDNAKPYMVEGVFDQYGLPKDYDMFVTSLLKFMGFYNFGLGETLLKLNYGRKRRCKDQYIYLSCIFEEHGKTYYYRTEDDTIDINDFLVVEAGSDNHKAIVKVVGVDYYYESDVPLPLNRTRTILRRATDEDFS